MNTGNIPKRRLTRRQVAEGLKSVPMQSVLMGASTSKERTLTSKQLRFAEALALGDTKAGAYRKAYDSNGTGKTESGEGQRLANHPAVSHQVAAFQVAIEAARYATPAALRALVIERLTAHALDDANAPAQRLRALELLGKVTEVAAFTERRETVIIDSPAAARDKLIVSLRAAIQAPGSEAGTALLAELRRSRASEVIDVLPNPPEPATEPSRIDDGAPPPAPAPPLAPPGPAALLA